MSQGDGGPVRGLAPDWRRWVVDNLRRGLSGRAVIDAICEAGAPRILAEQEVAIIAETLAILAVEGGEARRLAAAARLVEEPTELATLTTLEVRGFEHAFYRANRPAYFPGLVRRWPALRDWTPEALSARFGEVEVDFCRGRSADPHCDRNHRDHTVRAPFREFLALVQEAPADNDLYLISRNRAVRDTSLHHLLDDLSPLPDVLDRARLRAGSRSGSGPRAP